jgi:hypothetical protein
VPGDTTNWRPSSGKPSAARNCPPASKSTGAASRPNGQFLRYTLAQALYFHLRTGVAEGKIRTRVYASDSPYDRMKTDIGEVATPMFEPQADAKHLTKLERLLREWVKFVKDGPDFDEPFTSFPIHDRHP